MNFLIRLCAIVLIAFGGVFFLGSYNFAQAQKMSLKLYGQNFSVTPFQMDDTNISFQDVAAYVKTVLPDAGTRTLEVSEINNILLNRSIAYSRIYEASLENTVAKIKKRLPAEILAANEKALEEDPLLPDPIEYEISIYIGNGNWKELSQKYSQYDASLEPFLFNVQKLRYSQLAIAYLSSFVFESDEVQELYAPAAGE